MANYNNAAAAKNPPWQQHHAMPIAGQQQNVLNTGLLQYPQTALLQAQQLIQQNTSSLLQYPNQQQQYGNTANTNSGYNQLASASNVTYPTRHLNSTAFATPATGVMNSGTAGQGLLGAGQGLLGQSPATFPKQRVFTGTVTKRQDNFGFVDEDVFFQVDVCSKGSNPRLGDKVLVEAAYNPSMPFKWNATRIQVLPMDKDRNQGYSRFSNGSSRYSPQPNDDFKRRGNTNSLADRNRGPVGFNRNRSPDRNSDRKRRFDVVSKEDKDNSPRTRSPKKDEREEKRDREKSPSRRDSSVSRKSRSISPKRRRTRPIARYAVTVPKFALDLAQADLLELRRRYQNMYIPSDFFISSSVWLEAFPPDRPFSLQHPCSFHIMSKDVEPYLANTAELDAPDADYLFSAKVMLLSMPKLEEVFKKCVSLGEELNDKDYKSVVHPSRLINFLVGMRGKNETMAIGGPWSESLDGPNPDKDPSILIKTAIRTTRALTGIDLSKCTKWFKFLELYYRRQETTHKGKPVAARVETVVIYVPDVWNCVPTQLEWDGLTVNYKKMYTTRVSDKPEEGATKPADDDKDATMDGETSVIKREPTHYSLLDIKNMKVQDLREELEARSLSSKGLKSQLTARLAKALKAEQAADDVKGEAEDEEEEEEEKKEEKKEDGDKKDDGEKKEEGMTEKEKQRLERKYTLPETSSILVHPSTTAKSGKFQCEVMSLSLLLDYRIDDAKEHSFEVACFAELFNEMLMRDFGFQIFKAIHNAPEPVKEEKEEKEKKEKSKSDEDKAEDSKDSKEKESADKEVKAEKETDKKDKDEESKDKEEKKEDKDEKKDKDKKERDRKREDREKRREKEKQKFYTENPFLLLCCVYFDTTHIGYMYDKDLEDLLLTLGLSLSRSQVKKLVQKVLARERFNYRELTDKPLVEGIEKTTLNEIKLDIELLKQLIEGNKKFLPVFVDPSLVGKSPKKGAKGSSGAVMDSGLVMFQGSLVDIGNLQTSLEKSDVARNLTESALTKLRSEYASLDKSAAKLKDKLEKMTVQLDKTTKDLFETQTRRAEATETKEELMKVLEDIHRRVGAVVAKPKKEDKKEETEKEEEQIAEPAVNGQEDVKEEEESVKEEIKKEKAEEETEEPMDE